SGPPHIPLRRNTGNQDHNSPIIRDIALQSREVAVPHAADGVLVVGTGSWGTALAIAIARSLPVTLLCRTPAERDTMQESRRNERFLPAVAFPAGLELEYDVERGCASATTVVLVVPTSRMRENARLLAPHIRADHVVLSGAKGFEGGSLLRMTEVLIQELSQARPSIGALSGPNLAREVAAGKPATAVVASASPAALAVALGALNTPLFRVYANPDVLGVELGGALKNIIAIGAGAGDGLDAGENAKAAFVTRGLAEISRLGVALGAQPVTFAGLAGLGDLLATVSSSNSRNHFVGAQLAHGRSIEDIQAALAPQVAEGIATTLSARALAQMHGVEMPITEQSYQVLYENKNIATALADLMYRDPRYENDR
ncbi:MAG: NAD(P)-dependent glycerol-3-phosphate dehydrogenase, partial [Chloroflexota bacterium]|nr:NAD(P)-dependent glycerol-3-phosphate dehydrogenase [Chloroflexota bacterium]